MRKVFNAWRDVGLSPTTVDEVAPTKLFKGGGITSNILTKFIRKNDRRDTRIV